MMLMAGLPGPSAVLSGDQVSRSALSWRGSPRPLQPSAASQAAGSVAPQQRARRPLGGGRKQRGQGGVLIDHDGPALFRRHRLLDGGERAAQRVERRRLAVLPQDHGLAPRLGDARQDARSTQATEASKACTT